MPRCLLPAESMALRVAPFGGLSTLHRRNALLVKALQTYGSPFETLIPTTLRFKALLARARAVNQREIAPREGLIRARYQIMSLLRLAADMLDSILPSAERPNPRTISEAALRLITHSKEPGQQIEAFARTTDRDC